MGMYNTFEADVTCPKCKTRMPECEVQSKAGDCKLLYIKPGAYFSEQFRYVDGIASCEKCSTGGQVCSHCNNKEPRREFIFGVRIKIDEEGHSTGNATIVDGGGYD